MQEKCLTHCPISTAPKDWCFYDKIAIPYEEDLDSLSHLSKDSKLDTDTGKFSILLVSEASGGQIVKETLE